MYTLQLLAPFVAGICFDNFVTKQGTLCNFRENSSQVIKYAKQDPEHACYRDGIFYPRCADYDNPEVRHYHNLLYKK